MKFNVDYALRILAFLAIVTAAIPRCEYSPHCDASSLNEVSVFVAFPPSPDASFALDNTLPGCLCK